MTGRVVVVGSANVDLVVDVPRQPHGGETVLGGDLRRSPGGKGANQAVAAALAGGAETTFLGAFGSDDGADLLLASLTNAGVRTDLVSRVDSATGTAFIMVSPDGENSIVVAPGANARLSLGEAQLERIAAADVVLAQLEIPLEAVTAAAAARRSGARMVLNAAPSRPLPELDLDVLVVNEHEAADLAGIPGTPEELARTLQKRAPAVVITLGAAGCVVADQEIVQLPGFRVSPVDTTGAGDTFCGVLAAALAEGRPLREAAERAGAAAALAVTRPGAQSAVPTAAEVAEFAAGGNAR
ncbi:ribokinase [Amycolatopsis sp. AA4]|uniref:ribokinase n=1 Tax=Actinomycetes TaxID=1760 RepID=UPI0001DEE54A|nr:MULTISPECIES: ribokinase [Actinomycetes]ATY12639.1 ribokinase [Amycolatopsis sp. AA4]EFL08440.1 ribokinase [Streptomyces sp. AA4]